MVVNGLLDSGYGACRVCSIQHLLEPSLGAVPMTAKKETAPTHLYGVFSLPRSAPGRSASARPARREASVRAAGSGRKPCSRMSCNTRSRTSGRTPGCWLSTRDAVEREMPASLAICFRVSVMVSPRRELGIGSTTWSQYRESGDGRLFKKRTARADFREVMGSSYLRRYSSGDMPVSRRKMRLK